MYYKIMFIIRQANRILLSYQGREIRSDRSRREGLPVVSVMSPTNSIHNIPLRFQIYFDCGINGMMMGNVKILEKNSFTFSMNTFTFLLSAERLTLVTRLHTIFYCFFRRGRCWECRARNNLCSSHVTGNHAAHRSEVDHNLPRKRIRTRLVKVIMPCVCLGVHSVHPLEFVGVGIVKPVLSKPRTVDPLAYGWGNLEKYHREKDEQDTIKLSTLAVKERLENMETRICNAHSPLNPDNFGKLAHRTWTEFGKEMHDSLTYEEFQDCLRFLDIHMTDPKAKPLFRVGDLDNSGLMSFDEFKFVLTMVSQLPRPRMVSLWEVFLIFSKQNYGFINDFEFWKILTVSTNISCEIEKGEAKFLAFRDYHRANFPEFILNYERFCELWVKTVCEMGYCRTELIRRGVSKSQLKKHKVNARGPAAYLRHVVGQIDAWDQLSFERAKKWAFEHRKRIRVTRSIKLADRTKLRVDDDAKKRKEVAVVLKEKQVEDMIKERRRVQREKVETKLMRQMKEEAQNREERERQVSVLRCLFRHIFQ